MYLRVYVVCVCMHDGVSMGACGYDLCTQFSYLNAPAAVSATARYPNVSGSPDDRVTLTQAIPASSATVDIPPLGPASKHTAGDQEQVSDTLLLHVSLPFIYLQPDYCMTLTIHIHSDHTNYTYLYIKSRLGTHCYGMCTVTG